MPDVWGLAEIIVKLCLYLSVLTASGMMIVRAVFAAELQCTDRSLRRIVEALAFAGIAFAVASFALRGAALTGDASGITDPQILGILWQTPVGTALALRVGGLAAIMAGLFMGATGKLLSLIGVALALWSFTTIGHVSEDALWAQLLLLAHLLGIAFWIGILWPLQRMASEARTWPAAAALGEWFGKIASVVVPVLVLAGLIHGWRLVGSLVALVGSGYGLTLLAKIALVALLLGLAAANKLRFVPGLHAGDPRAARHLTRTIGVEWGVFAAILLATSILTSVFAVPT
ncbi:copper resistance D family protein [Gymnodinialimonas ceratoperidinii]|uniref:CopD family protein n=1 Tax=Gymnodinialimonas ceratoperidinii TaxID=2856823 RepID=A0A8F6TVJ1_9RHOB|nr:CopD family protein [Gymnodinialimonas ceratoperidinii]QXT39480.1 CopD family protein [Gymnodinialimonas ceratoperidinii]